MKTAIKFPESLVKRVYNSTIVSILVSVIVVGIMLIMSHNIIDFEDDTPISMVITGGVILAILASVRLSFSLKRTVLSDNGEPLICKTISFYESDYEKVKTAVADGRWFNVKDFSNSGVGIAMKIEIVYTPSRSFGAYQFFRYVPHCYAPCSEIVYFDKESASTLFKRDR